MSIKPIDVRRKEFESRFFGGYDPNEVDDFLDSVADEFEQTYTENLRIKEEVSAVRRRLEQFEELEDSIRSALVQAERAAEDLRHNANQEADNARMNANREAELTIREAKTRSQQILADASARMEHLSQSYEAMKQARDRFSADFRKLLESYLAVMENAGISSPENVEASLRERLDIESTTGEGEAGEEEAGEATRQMQWWPAEEPETDEPEVEPSEHEQPDAEHGAGEEPAPAEESRSAEAGESDDEDAGRSGRVSRFMRRHGRNE